MTWVDRLNEKNVSRAQDREAASIRRLKQRIASVSWRFEQLSAASIRRDINAAIDAWRKAEEKRGGR